MPQYHQMDLTVSGKGEIKIDVHYRGQVPDLLGQFSEEVRARAMRFVWWKSRYERQLLRACRLMPEWAKATVRQHILHERAVRVEAKLKRQAERRARKEARRSASIVARVQSSGRAPDGAREAPVAKARLNTVDVRTEHHAQRQVQDVPPVQDPPRPEREMDAPGQGWGAPVRELPRLSLTEQFAQETSALKAVPRPEMARDRGR